jgi:hypothetical protein
VDVTDEVLAQREVEQLQVEQATLLADILPPQVLALLALR